MRFAKRLDMPQRRELCMPHAKSKAGVVARHEYKVPSYVAMYNFLKRTPAFVFMAKRGITNKLPGIQGRTSVRPHPIP